ncbi:MAG: pre-peptidase C-terminal domain-containing protein [Gammaproteobacteria bacterium]|nr:pre-peptidase C-terminal domain-containing protein [Gammaproteobacteria bacterium]
MIKEDQTMNKYWIMIALLGSIGSIPSIASANKTVATTEASLYLKQDINQILEQEQALDNYYRVYYHDDAMRVKLVVSFHGQLMMTEQQQGYVVLQLDNKQLQRLQRDKFKVVKDSQFAQQIQQRLKSANQQWNSSATTTAIPGYSCYETVEETFSAAQQLVTDNPQLASWIDVGDSWEKINLNGGYDIRVLKLTNQATSGNKPKLFINSAIHAREYTTAPLNLDFARWLLNQYQTNADARWILDHHEVHLMLQTNPDGRKRAEAGSSWRKNTNQNYCGATSSSRGADLNRNFTDRWNITNGQGSSGSQCSSTYRGPSAGSEPEIQALETYVRSLWPDRRGSNDSDAAPVDTSGIHIDLHSYSELVLWPWGDKNSAAPNGTALTTLGRKFAFFNGYLPQQSIGLYPTDGTSDNVSYSELGVAAFTFELGTSFFQNCSTYNNTIYPDNLPALIYAAKVVRAPYLIPRGPDTLNLALSNDASDAGVPAGTTVDIAATVSDNRFSTRNGSEPSQPIKAAEYFIDTPPWQAGATAYALAAADGNFNSVSEAVSGAIDTTGLALGEHIVYVRGVDSNDNAGAVSAVFLNITDGTPSLEANFEYACFQLSCDFNAASSSGNIVSYQWTFGDGDSASAQVVSHDFSAPGSYSVTLTVFDNQGNTDQIVKTVVVDSAANNQLENGVPKVDLSGAQAEQVIYQLSVPSDASGLTFTINGGTGDADLYVRFGAEPTTSEYDCRPYRNGNNETCSFNTPQAGVYYVMLRGYSAYSGLTLVAQYSQTAPGGEFSETNLSGATGQWQHFPITLPANMSTLTVTLSGGSGDADLYVRQGSQPTTSNYDCRPYRWGNEESCQLSSPQAGVWYVSIRAYSDYANVSVVARWQ